MSAVLGIDLGTTEVKVGLFALDGSPLATARAGYGIDMPRPGWAEQRVDDWWAGTVRAVRQVVSLAGDMAPRAVAVAGQGPTVVVADGNRQPLRPAITWMDSRAAAEAAEIEAGTATGGWRLGVLPASLWLARHEPAVAQAAHWYLMSWDYLAYRLCGVAAAASPDPSRAVRPEGLDALGIDTTRLAPPVAWGAVLGPLLDGPASELGLPPGLPVVAGANDATASFIGAGLQRPGQAIDTGGTSGGFAVYWNASLEVPGVFAGAAPIPGLWLYGGAMSATGKSLDWLAREIGEGGADMESLLTEAAQVPPGAGGLIFLPYLAGERSPIWDDAARGVMAGLTLRHRRGHMVRAVIEGAALAIRHVAAPIIAAGITVDEMRVCGGPARSGLWNQVKADVTGFPVAVPRVLETASLGAAMLAAVGAGEAADPLDAIGRMTGVEQVIEPRPATRELYDRLYETYTSLYPLLRPAFAVLAEVEAAGAAVGPDLGNRRSDSFTQEDATRRAAQPSPVAGGGADVE